MSNEIIEKSKLLKFRNTKLVYLNIEGTNLFPDNWIYVHSPNLKTGRITNFRNWVPELYGEENSSIVCLEYWCNKSEEIWSWSDNNLIELGMKELLEIGLIGIRNIKDGYVLRINKCYPVYSLGHKSILKPIQKFLYNIKGLLVIGRY